MKIFFDARYLESSGIGRYCREIIKNLCVQFPETNLTLAGNIEALTVFIKQYDLPTERLRLLDFNAKMYSLAEQITGPIICIKEQKNHDLFFFPHYTAPFLIPKNSIVVIHDLIQFQFSEHYHPVKLFLASRILKNSVSKASSIITVSRHSGECLKKMFPANSEKIHPIHLGINPFFKRLEEKEIEEFKKQKGLSSYLLYVGNKKYTKNIKRLLDAFNLLRQEMPTDLVLIGKNLESVPIEGKGVHDLVDVPDEELRLYYNGAQALVFPSLAEGFGFPPLEAMACGCPAVVSNASSLPEVCGQAAVYIDPYDPFSIKNGILTAIKGRETYVRNGISHVDRYQWKTTAELTFGVFKKTIS